MKRIKPKAGQESVWDYPRPPKVEDATERIKVIHTGVKLVDSSKAKRVLETSHPPVYYIPQEDILMAYLQPETKQTWCEFKGTATYWTLRIDNEQVHSVAWSYPNPTPGFDSIKNYLAFYPSKVDACFLGDEQIKAQEGDFYGGWISSGIVGPFKGPAGTFGW